MSTTKAYGIEDKVWSGKFHRHQFVRDGMSIDRQKQIVETLCDTFNRPPITVKRKRQVGSPRVNYGAHAIWAANVISLQNGCGSAVICHEVAHIFARDTDDGHGPMWRAWYLACVDHVLGGYHANRLKKAFAEEYGPATERVAKDAYGDYVVTPR